MDYDVNLTREIKEYLLAQGADLVGIAPVDRFDKGPEETHPRHYMPDATCVISIGMSILGGACDVWGESDEAHKTISSYLFYGYGLLNMETSRIGNLAAKRLLEFRGHKSLMFPPTWSIGNYRFLQRNSEPEVPFLHDFSHRHAAVAAGLGEFGFNALLLVPKFGARLRLNSIITNAPLVPDPMYSGPKICDPDKCGYLCVRKCPSEALSVDSTCEAQIGGRVFKYAKSDKVRCIMAVFAMVKGSGGRTKRVLEPRDKKRYAMADFWNGFAENDPIDKGMLSSAQGIICGDFCGKCLHLCPAYRFSKPAEAINVSS